MNHSITIYSTPTCHFCHMSKDYFKSKGFTYEDVNVGFGGDPARQKEMISKSGQLGVPVIDIDGKIVIGFDRSKIDKLLQ